MGFWKVFANKVVKNECLNVAKGYLDENKAGPIELIDADKDRFQKGEPFSSLYTAQSSHSAILPS